ncbi:MAG: heavy metal-associated domain-containing protein [Ferruginibacter sp.]
MKKILFTISLVLFMVICNQAQAQKLNEWLKTKKEEAKTKVNTKVDQKSSAGIDNALNKPEEMIKKKKEKNKEKKAKNKDAKADETAVIEKTNESKKEVSTDNSMNGEGAQTVIQTNINCQAGKSKVESMLKKQDGIFEVKANITNGEVAIRYSSDGTSYSELLKLINQQGFEADGNKPNAGAPANPCKK